jgi:hypothetical protein
MWTFYSIIGIGIALMKGVGIELAPMMDHGHILLLPGFLTL